ncbi:Glycoside hydrolase [Parasponia andersonii]|uniref:Glycoside hydrolase n=1 Tax=Parasponia andersonii TaxID=3476 RepID=A0A2P5AQU5_PARAD|nr:Glycoside hydrolase [Parasponia andersonii]
MGERPGDPGEDPMVASAYAVNFVKGFRGGNKSRVGDVFWEKTLLEGDDDDDESDDLMLSACGMHFNVMKYRYITSDCDAVTAVFGSHHYAKNPEDAVADVLKAGTDIDCGAFLYRHTLSAIEQGKVQEEDLGGALLILFSVQLRFGLFNGDPLKGRYGRLGPQDVCNSEHKKLALEAGYCAS